MPELEKIVKVAIADDHSIYRKGLILSLRKYTNIKFVQEADNGQHLINHLLENDPEVILMDLKMPVKDGIETTKYLKKHFPSIKILMLTMYEDKRFVRHLMDSGVNGYLLKTTNPGEINRAISDVMRTGFYLNNFLNKILIKRNYSIQKSNDDLNNKEMSDQEKYLLTFVGKEYTSGEIEKMIDNCIRILNDIKDKLMEFLGIK